MRIAEMVEVGRIEYREVPRPSPGTGELVIQTRAVGLCGTDLKAYLRGHPYFTPPCVLGHEFTGTVVDVGVGVDDFRVGDNVVAAPYVECGVCERCRRGLGELCRSKAFVEGALQEFVRLPRDIVEKATFRLPPRVDVIVGALTEPLACVMNGIERAAVRAHDTVLIVGGGPMGALLATVARSAGADVAVSELAPARIDALRALGLSVLDPSDESVPDRLEEEFGAATVGKVLIAVGLRSVAEEALSWTAPGGVALLFGGLPKVERMAIDPFRVHYEEVSIVGSFGFRLDHFRAALEWLSAHADQAAPIVSDRVTFDQVETGFESARRAEGLKTIVTFGETDER
jgi:L-iditol 2-dehydrogenase